MNEGMVSGRADETDGLPGLGLNDLINSIDGGTGSEFGNLEGIGAHFGVGFYAFAMSLFHPFGNLFEVIFAMDGPQLFPGGRLDWSSLEVRKDGGFFEPFLDRFEALGAFGMSSGSMILKSSVVIDPDHGGLLRRDGE